MGHVSRFPAHTCTLTECFGRPFSFDSHSRWKLSLLWFLSRTEHSSVNNNYHVMKLLIYKQAHLTELQSLNSVRLSNQLTIFCTICSHPSFLLKHLFLSGENWMPKRAWIQLVNSGDVNSSFPSILASIKFIRSIVTPRDGRPGFGALSSDCLSLNLIKNWTLLWL